MAAHGATITGDEDHLKSILSMQRLHMGEMFSKKYCGGTGSPRPPVAAAHGGLIWGAHFFRVERSVLSTNRDSELEWAKEE